MVPKIISGYNEETKQFTYILEGDTCNYNLSRLLAMPAVSDIFSSFQYRKDVVFCNGIIQKGFLKMLNRIPDYIINKFIAHLDDKNATEDMEWRLNLNNCSLSMYIEDDVAQKNIPAIFFDFNKYKPGCKKSGKIVILDEYFITVEIFPGVIDVDHPENNRMFTVYSIIDRNNINDHIYVIIGESYDTRYMIDGLATYSGVKNIINFDSNHVVHHYVVIYTNSGTESFVEAIDIVKDVDNMAGIYLLDNHFNSITKTIMSIGDEVPDNLQRIKFLVNYDELENSHVYDLFGNYTTFKQLRDSISIRRN